MTLVYVFLLYLLGRSKAQLPANASLKVAEFLQSDGRSSRAEDIPTTPRWYGFKSGYRGW